MKRFISKVLIFSLVIMILGSGTTAIAQAKSKEQKISSKKIQLYVGKTKTIKLKNASKKVKWKVANKKIVKIVKKSGKKNNTIKIKALKAGKTKINVKCGKKKYVVKVTVKKKKGSNKGKVTTVVETETTVVEQTTNSEQVTTAPRDSDNEQVTTAPTDSDNEQSYKTEYSNEYYKMNASAENDKLEIGEDLVLVLDVVENRENKDIYWGRAPISFEKLVNGEWTPVSYAEDFYGFQEDVIVFSGVGTIKWTVKLSEIYSNVTPGHYRYMHKFGGIDVSIEFDVVYSNEDVKFTAVAENNVLIEGEALTVNLAILEAKEDATVYYGEEPVSLERYADGIWTSVNYAENFGGFTAEPLYFSGIGNFEWTVDLEKIYSDIQPGYYRYTHNFGGVDVPIEFHIVSSRDISVTANFKEDAYVIGDRSIILEFDITGLYNNAFVNYYDRKLEILKEGKWILVNTISDESNKKEGYNIYPSIDGSAKLSMYIFIGNGYKLEEGHYRYTQRLLGTEASAEFDVLASE